MAKESGIGMTVGVDNSSDALKQIEDDITSLDFAIPRGISDITGVKSASMEKLLTLSDFSITLNGVFNDAADKSHAIFKDVSSTSVTRTVSIAHSGQTLAVETVFTDYQLNRALGGDLTWTAPGQMNANDSVAAWS